MQREAPEGPSLLATARDALLQEILPKLSGTDAFKGAISVRLVAMIRSKTVGVVLIRGINDS